MGMGSGLAQVQAQVGGLGRELQQQKAPGQPVPPPVNATAPPVFSPVYSPSPSIPPVPAHIRHDLVGGYALREPGGMGPYPNPPSRADDSEVVYGPSSGMSYAGESTEGDLNPRRHRRRSERPRESRSFQSKRSPVRPPSDSGSDEREGKKLVLKRRQAGKGDLPSGILSLGRGGQQVMPWGRLWSPAGLPQYK